MKSCVCSMCFGNWNLLTLNQNANHAFIFDLFWIINISKETIKWVNRYLEKCWKQICQDNKQIIKGKQQI